jgi:hypothetical protein
VYAVALLAAILAVLTTRRIRVERRPRAREPFTMHTVLAGFRYIWTHKLVLGSISLDLFAVLLGGAVALLPVYAKEILHTGPWGLGLLRSAPGIGAGTMALLIAYKTDSPASRRDHALLRGGIWIVYHGIRIFAELAAFAGLVTFCRCGGHGQRGGARSGHSAGHTGRDERPVNAVDMIFIGASNELGEFESGLLAQWLGAVPAVVLGGAGTILVVGLWAWLFPELRSADRLVGTRV